MIAETSKHDAEIHAAKEFPRESCGLVLNLAGTEAYFPCRNMAEKNHDFLLDPADYARAEDMGEILGVVHSHPNAPPRPSQPDLVACELSGLPWHIVSVPGDHWYSFKPTGYRAPYTGRKFSHGTLDCYSLIRDWYKGERFVDLPDFERSEEWWRKGGNLYLEHFGEAGFRAIIQSRQLQIGDVLLMQFRSPVPNHAAIYIGDGMILHHVMGRLSCREPYGGFWQKCTTHILRRADNA